MCVTVYSKKLHQKHITLSFSDCMWVRILPYFEAHFSKQVLSVRLQAFQLFIYTGCRYFNKRDVRTAKDESLGGRYFERLSPKIPRLMFILAHIFSTGPSPGLLMDNPWRVYEAPRTQEWQTRISVKWSLPWKIPPRLLVFYQVILAAIISTAELTCILIPLRWKLLKLLAGDKLM